MLSELEVLVVDCQTTSSSPAEGMPIEIAWARLGPDGALAVRSELVALPEGHRLPWPVARLTGIDPRALESAPAPERIWSALREEAVALTAPAPTVVHFARFERSFLAPLHARAFPGEPFPLDLICTHEIARRLLPELPRRSLRALAGYFGFDAKLSRRSQGHVEATAHLWRHLARELEVQGLHRWEELAGWLEDPSIAKIGHDLGGLGVALGRHGIHLAGVVGDSASASHLFEPSNFAPHDLSVIAPHLLHRAVPEEDGVRGVGLRRKPWSAIATDRAAAHAAELARASAEIWAALEPKTDRELFDEYLALTETLTRMQLRGIACDADDLVQSGEAFEQMVAALEEQIHAIAGKRFNVNSTKQLGAVLFDDLGLTIVKKTKTGWSTATDALERIQHEHPIVPLVIRYRLLRRLIDAWVTGLIGHISDDGRVHATMYAARSFSGRVICAAPDLGRVPGKTSEMARIRHAFRAAPGHVILSVDYRQLGLYVLAHLTRDPALVEPLRERADMHRLTASAVLERPADALGPDERQLGKVVNFATFAGQGASALALELGVTAQRAKEIIARFDRRYAVVRAFQDEQLRLARERGYIVTLAGRRWPIAGLDSPDVMMRAYAERLARRATHEGSVADVSRRGLLHADRALRAAGLRAAPLLQVHDEVLFEVPEAELGDAARLAAEAMQSAFDLAVPLRVGVEAGPNWADLEELHVE